MTPKTTLRLLLTALVGASLVLASACGTPSIESRIQSYKKAKDNLDLLSTKMPHLKADIAVKQAEFEAEFQAAQTKGGEEGSKDIGRLVTRMTEYENKLNPQKAQVAAKPAGSKVAPAAGQVAPGAVAPVGAKVGAPAPAPPAPVGTKLGAPAPAPPASPAPPAPPAPVGTKLGAPAPAPVGTKVGAPAPAPAAPAPAPAPAGGGFGGK